jgi:hypothetical protein
VAYKQGQVQNSIMDEVMELPKIHDNWDSEEVMNIMRARSESFNFDI